MRRMYMSLTSISTISLYSAFALYSIATIFFGLSITDKRKDKKNNKIGNVALAITIIGFVMQVIYFITRWIVAGHAPLSNLFEFMTFLGLSLVLAFIIIYFIYRVTILGLFALPVALIIIAYASMFPTEISPLVPSLQSPWLWIHVTTVSLSQGILGISFVAGLIYLIRQVDQTRRNKSNFWLEVVLFSLVVFIGFVISTVTFNIMDYHATFEVNDGATTIEYHLPPISGPAEGTLVSDSMQPLMTTPGWMQGADADRKFNTLIWSFLSGLIIYGITRLLLRKRIGAAIKPLVKNTKPDMLDEIVYRAVAIGFPVFKIGR